MTRRTRQGKDFGNSIGRSLPRLFRVPRDDRVVGKKVWISWDLKLGKTPDQIEQRYFTEAQMNAIVDQAQGMWKTLFATLRGTGMRIGEAAALDASDVDLVNNVITVRRQFSQISGGMLPPKSKRGYREIDLDDTLAYLLRVHLSERTSELLFQARNGSPLRGGNIIRSVLNPILRQLRIPTGARLLHAFRHGRTTVLRKNGVPGDLQKLWIGHSSFEMTDRYSHTDQELQYRREHAMRRGSKVVQ